MDFSGKSELKYSIFFSLKLKEEELKSKKTKTTEEEYDYKSGALASTVSKGEKRTAHIPNVSTFCSWTVHEPLIEAV